MKQLLKHPRFPLVAACLAGFGILAWVISGFLASSNEPQRVEKAQSNLVEAITKNQRGKARKLVHPDYADSLGHDRLQALNRLFELRAQVSELSLETELLEEISLDETTGEAQLKMNFTQLEGGGGLFGDVMIPKIRQSGLMEAEVSTRWKREGLWPGRWKLIELEFDEKLKLPANYDPAKTVREQVTGGLDF